MVGKALLGLAIIWVHITMATERSIDEKVVRAFHRETFITVFALLLIVGGYIMEVTALGGFSFLMSCSGAECAASAMSALLPN